MFINKLSQIYKPNRILYYIDATDEEIQAYYDGTVPESIAEYANKFGTYDYPGVFFIEPLGKSDSERKFPKPVIGIEFRENDSRIKYPQNLKSVHLNEVFFYSVEIENEIEINIHSIKQIFERVSKDDDAHRFYSDFSIMQNPGLICVFSTGKKIRMLYEWKIVSDRALHVIKDDIDALDKSFLYKMAYTDVVTNHYTWYHFVPFIEMPKDAGITDYAFAHFDVKEFEVINEVYGHNAANKVLCKIAKAMNESDFIYTSARCHNDNFTMLLKDMPQDELKARLEKFFEDLSYLEEDPNYKIYYRCGVVPMQRAMLSGNRVADAGKMAQALGTNSNKTDIVFYTDKMHDDLLWGNYIKAYAETAIEKDEFIVYLQPKFDINKEKIKGAEALIRWNYKSKEFLPPYKFIPFFEKDGSIDKIDDIVLKKVCEALARWKKEGKALFPISVNLSRTRMYDKNIINYLTGIVDSYGIDHSLIDFELTESATYNDFAQMLFVLNGLKEKGFKISIDDFGTGYSSLSLLTQMPVDTLKIDKSFVDKVGTDKDNGKDLTVLRHIISLAKELNFTCLAEGAEEKPQVDKLRSLGCEIIQGYYYSKPIPMDEYEERYLRSM